MIKKYYKFYILFFILFLSLGVVYADNLDDASISYHVNEDIDKDVATSNVFDENLIFTIDDNPESINQVNPSNMGELSEDIEIDNVKYVEGSTFDDIQKAINSSQPGDKIILKGNYTGKNVINIKKSLTIEGYDNNVFLKGIGTESLIVISSIAENVTLKNLRFSYRGYNDWGDQSYDSPIKWGGINGTIINCYFNNCTSHGNGGAIFWTNSKGSILNCTFYNCTSFGSGGAISLSGNDCKIDNCIFKDCNCAGLYQFGGAIYNLASDSQVSNCLFEDTYSNNGAAIFSSMDSTVNITITKCIFKNSYATIGDPLYGGVAIDCTFDFENNYKTLLKYHAKLSSSNYYSYYLSTKKLAVKLLKTIDNKPLENVKLHLKVKVGNSYKNLYATTGSNGIAYFNLKSLNVGAYKTVTVSSTNSNIIVSIIKPQLVITKAKTIISAPKVTNKYKKSKYFKVTVKNKATKKVIKSLKIKLKVYTGKKYKTYTIKTNSKGIAKLNTKSLKKGNHRVSISSGNKNYSISKTSYIKIKK